MNWKVNINPSNILQIDWKQEKKSDGKHRSWEEAYAVLVGGAKQSTFEFIKNLPDDWKEELKNGLD